MSTHGVIDASGAGPRAALHRLWRTLPALGLAIALAISAGCGTTYCYRGTLTAEDTAGETQEFVLYWNKTERPLWFDECEGTVRLKPELGTAIGFNEDAEGLIFRNDGTFAGMADRMVAVGGACGRIMTANRVVDLTEGTVLVVVWCLSPNDDEFSIGGAGLVPREEPYVFVVRRMEVPAGTDCRESDGFEGLAGAPDPE